MPFSTRSWSRISYLLLLPLLLISCDSTTTEPDDPFNVGIAKTIGMVEMTERPKLGGDVRSVSILDDGSVVAVLEGDLVRILKGESPEMIDDSRTYLLATVGPDETTIAHTATEILVYPPGFTTPVVRSIPESGPVGANGPITSSRIMYGPNGRVILTFATAAPRTYALYGDLSGETWTELKFESGDNFLRTRGGVAITSNGTILAGNFEGITATRNLGISWDVRTRGVPNSDMELLIGSDGTLYRYAPGDGGFAYSTDGGVSFVEATLSIFPPYFIDVVEGASGELWALANMTKGNGADPQDHPMGLYRSTDRGENWEMLLPVQAHGLSVERTKIAIGLVDNLTSGEPTPGGLLVSGDGGALWEMNGTRKVAEITDFANTGEGTLHFVNSGAVVERRSVGLNMVAAPAGIRELAGSPEGSLLWTTDVNTSVLGERGGVVAEIEGSGRVVSMRDGSFLLLKEGAVDRVAGEPTVSNVYTGPLTFERMIEAKVDELLATVQGDTVAYRSTDGGVTWTKTEEMLPLACNRDGACVRVDEENGFLFVAADGKSGTPLIFNDVVVTPETIRRLEFDGRGRLWLLTTDGRLYGSDVVLL